MHPTRLFACLALLMSAGTASAQQIIQVPGGDQTAGRCTSYPLGHPYCRYQTLVTASQLGDQPGTITELSLKPCSTANLRLRSMLVRVEQTTASTLSATLDDNISRSATAIFSTGPWTTQAHQWTALGVYQPFSYNGRDNLVIEFLVTNTALLSNANTRIANTAQPRAYSTRQGATTGVVDQQGQIMQLHVIPGHVLTHGTSCATPVGLADLTFRGRPSIGSSLDIHGGPFPGRAPLFLSIGSRPPSPFSIDLTPFGAPGCSLYHHSLGGFNTTADPAFHAMATLALPNQLSLVGGRASVQWVCVSPRANALGVATTEGATITIGQ